MDFFSILFSNDYLNAGVLSWFIAQALKLVLALITTKKINLERLVGNGGMPSSHSAFTVTIAIMIARTAGFASPEFAVAVAFSLVVMNDAMGVRRAAGDHARAINNLIFEISDIPALLGFEKQKSVTVEVPLDELEENELKEVLISQTDDEIHSEKLKELLGHTPFEVLGGFILGVIIGLLMPIR